jgi:two-component system, NtrC family, sensor histidine kinase HydH
MRLLKKVKKRYFIYIIFILAYIGIIVLILSVFSGEAEHSRLLLEYETERTVSFFMESLMRNFQSEEITLPDNVLGFGLYDFNGDTIRAWGDAPLQLDLEAMGTQSTQFTMNKEKQSFILIRRIGFGNRPQGFFNGRHPMERMRQRMNKDLPHILFFEIDASHYLYRLGRRQFLTFSIPLFLLIVMAGLLILYKKNREYRKKLASREQLIRLGEMARVLAHEIKNPLGAMRIQTGYLKKILPGNYHPDLFLIEEEIDRLSLLTNRISDFVRDPLGSPEKIALESFIRNLLKRFNAPITFSPGISDDRIFFDRERLRSVLENVINNAIDSHKSLADTHPGPVELELKGDKKYITLVVRDRGQGIPYDKKEKVFDPFYTTRAKGSGIGLSITKRFVEARKGKITIDIREGGGTEVRLFFNRQYNGFQEYK